MKFQEGDVFKETDRAPASEQRYLIIIEASSRIRPPDHPGETHTVIAEYEFEVLSRNNTVATHTDRATVFEGYEGKMFEKVEGDNIPEWLDKSEYLNE